MINYMTIPGIKQTTMTPEQIKEIVCEEFGVDNFIVKHRMEKERMPRHVYAYLLRKFTRLTYEEIGTQITRDHSSAIYSARFTRDDLLDDYKFGLPTWQCIKRCNHIAKKELEKAKESCG